MVNHSTYSLKAALATFNIDVDVPSVTLALKNDSRFIEPHDVFCAVIGQTLDGRRFTEQAVSKGAACVISECIHPQQHGKLTFINRVTGELTEKVPVIHFYQLNQRLIELAMAYYQQPQQYMKMVGVTGTNGKSSVCWLVAQLAEKLGQKTAIVGTLGAGESEQLKPLNNTTPAATELMSLLAQFNQQGVKQVAMEVSSHALVQQRVSPALFDIAVFTNLSRDHLDYHQTMTAYAAAKKQLFLDNENQIAIMNADDATTQEWLTQWQHQENLWLYSIEQSVTQTSHYLRATNIEHHPQGIRFTLVTPNGDYEIASPLMGRFNIENLLAAISVLAAQQVAITDIVSHIPTIKTVMGRMETFSQLNKATTVVDYAHTPDGLKQALFACRQHCSGDIWLIFGCGGDRDKGKRAEMGEIAEQLADHGQPRGLAAGQSGFPVSDRRTARRCGSGQ